MTGSGAAGLDAAATADTSPAEPSPAGGLFEGWAHQPDPYLISDTVFTRHRWGIGTTPQRSSTVGDGATLLTTQHGRGVTGLAAVVGQADIDPDGLEACRAAGLVESYLVAEGHVFSHHPRVSVVGPIGRLSTTGVLNGVTEESADRIAAQWESRGRDVARVEIVTAGPDQWRTVVAGLGPRDGAELAKLFTEAGTGLAEGAR